MTSAQIKQQKKITLLDRQARRARLIADVAQSKLEIAQGKYKTFKSAAHFMKYMERKYKLKK